jgi:hypothetical protein
VLFRSGSDEASFRHELCQDKRIAKLMNY